MVGYLVVFVGAGVGGMLRHFLNIWIAKLAGTHFPMHTFVINITGSIVMGVITALFALKGGATGHAGPGGDPVLLTELGAAAADCLARSVARGVYEATALPYATSLPDYRGRFGG